MKRVVLALWQAYAPTPENEQVQKLFSRACLEPDRLSPSPAGPRSCAMEAKQARKHPSPARARVRFTSSRRSPSDKPERSGQRPPMHLACDSKPALTAFHSYHRRWTSREYSVAARVSAFRIPNDTRAATLLDTLLAYFYTPTSWVPSTLRSLKHQDKHLLFLRSATPTRVQVTVGATAPEPATSGPSPLELPDYPYVEVAGKPF